MAAHCNLQVAAAFKANRCPRDCVLASLASRCNEGVERKCRRPEATSQAFSVCVHRPPAGVCTAAPAFRFFGGIL